LLEYEFVHTMVSCSLTRWDPLFCDIGCLRSYPTYYLLYIYISSLIGSHDECLASLRGHGIEPDVIPMTEGGTISDIDSYRQRLVRQRRQERLSQPRRTMIYVPMSRDVLFGKGTPIQNHVGNKKFRGLIADCQKRYEKAKKGEKLFLAQEIVDTVIESSGMFLKPEGDVWLPVGDDAARRKAGNSFRTLRKGERETG
jgi:hypothetical protein